MPLVLFSSLPWSTTLIRESSADFDDFDDFDDFVMWSVWSAITSAMMTLGKASLMSSRASTQHFWLSICISSPADTTRSTMLLRWRDIAEEFGVTETAVSRWIALARERGPAALFASSSP